MFKITLGVEGMRCPNCERHVTEAVSANFSVKKVTASHKNSEALIISEEELSREKLEPVIADTGYKVTSYSCEPYEKKGIFGI